MKIGNALRKNHRLAILAKPGGGKSTLIKRIAIAYAFPKRRKQVRDFLPKTNWFPIFIRCRELGDRVTDSITEIIYNIPNRAEIVSCTEAFKILVSSALQEGLALLLIDGLDEISEDRDRIAFVNQLRTFIARYPNINIVVTSREAGFRTVAGSLATYCKNYSISSLKEKEIESLTIRWHEAIVDTSNKTRSDAKSLAGLIIKDPRIRSLAENPLLLTTLLFVKRWAGYLPTKKSILYQEMVKLLLVTWNVEGHEQLDIDEAEPQLAFVSYRMTRRGEQTITEEELRKSLVESRQHMPEILNFSRISPTDFIKRVESRSSLLIMTGHKRMPDGAVSPIYEFLHLSFQEYFTAKAIVEKYLPKDESTQSNLSLLKDDLRKENWKEIVPLVAVLSRTRARDLIEHLVSESRQEAELWSDSSERNYQPVAAAGLLGACIANEVQISVELLEQSCEWIAKNRYASGNDGETVQLILNSKFGETFRKVVKSLFFDEFDNKFATALGGTLADIYDYDYQSDSQSEMLNRILTDLASEERETICLGILGLMGVAYVWNVRSTRNRPGLRIARIKVDRGEGKGREVDEFVNSVVPRLREFLTSDDKQIFMSSAWCLAWLSEGSLFPDDQRGEFAAVLIKAWINSDTPAISRMTAWSISRILRPNLEISLDEVSQLREKLAAKRLRPENEFDRTASLFVASIIKEEVSQAEVEQILNEEGSRGGKVTESFKEFAAHFNVTPEVNPQLPLFKAGSN